MKHVRRNTGSVMADTPATLWFLFILFAFPFIDLATIGLRSLVFVMATNYAAHAAAQAQTFSAPLVVNGRTYPSAQETANTSALQYITAWSGVALASRPTVTIIGTPIPGVTPPATPIDSTVPLATVPDSAKYVVTLRVAMAGSVDPLVWVKIPLLDNIPGLSAPVPMTAEANVVCENLSGLTY